MDRYIDGPAIPQKRYTYGDYLNFDNNIRCEIIDGMIFDMSPAPMRRHQNIQSNLLSILHLFFTGKNCKLYNAPFDVRLPLNGETDKNTPNVVQPDILVVCDRSKLDDYGCNGAPDWVIEILSQSTRSKDLWYKKGLYEEAGVREYWILDPKKETLIVYTQRSEGGYGLGTEYPADQEVTPAIFPELTVELIKVFAE